MSEIERLRRDIDSLKKERENDAAKKKERQHSADREDVTKLLVAAGVVQVAPAMNHLFAEELVKRTDEGLVCLRKDGRQTTNLSEGIADFLESDDGKIFARSGQSEHRSPDGRFTGTKLTARQRATRALGEYRRGAAEDFSGAHLVAKRISRTQGDK